MSFKLVSSLLIFLAIFSIVRGQHFTENVGQIKDQFGDKSNVLYAGQCSSTIYIQLHEHSFSYQLHKLIDEPKGNLKKESKPFIYEYERIDIQFINCNKNDISTLPSESTHREKYLLSGQSNEAHTSKSITYQNVYPNIDVEFLFNEEGKFKYNFIIHPGGNINDIQLGIKGSQKPNISTNKITFNNSIDPLNEHIPLSWTESKQGKKEVSVFYKKIDNSTFGFELANNEKLDTLETLVIDPIPTRLFGTYTGGSQQEQVQDIVLDKEGDSYQLGFTQSLNNIATTGTYQGTFNAFSDVFIIKHDENGNKIWGTYYGGNFYDRGFAIDYNNGHVFIAGNTFSMNMATSGVHQETVVDADEAFLAKFDTTGNLVWSTYYAGEMHDFFADVVVDQNNDIYCTGHTSSLSNIASPGSHQDFFLGTSACFIVKFDNTGNRIWGTYYGTANDDGSGLGIDSNNDLYVTGYTTSTNGIINTSNTGVHQTSLNGGADAFIAKFSPSGTLTWGTYYGGTGNDLATSIAVDSEDSIYIAGNTTSSNEIFYNNAFQATPSSIDDNFIAKFGPNGTISWGSYFGGNEADYITKIDSHPGGGIVFTGFTQSQTNIASAGAYQINHDANYDAYLGYFDENGQREWSSYYGGADADEGRAIALREDNLHLYVSGITASLNNMTSNGAEQTIYGGGSFDVFLAKFCPPILPKIKFDGDSEVCGGDSALFVLTNPVSFTNWQWSNGSANDTLLFTNDNQGNFDISITLTDTNNCPSFSDTITINVYPDNSLTVTGVEANYCAGSDSIQLGTGLTYDSYNWSTGGTNDTLMVSDPTAGTYTITLMVTDNNGCTFSDTLEVLVNDPPDASVQVNGSANFCLGETVDITLDQNYDSYAWHNGSTSSQITLNSEEWVWAIVENSFGCVDTTDSIYVDSDFLEPVLNISPSSPYCIGDTIILGTIFNYDQYDWSTGSVLSNDTLITNELTPGIYEFYVEVTNSCGSSAMSDTLEITLYEKIFPNTSIVAMDDPLCVGSTYEIIVNNTIYDQYFWDDVSGLESYEGIANTPGSIEHALEVVDTNGCVSTETITLFIDSCYLNISNCSGQDIAVYPNPASQTLIIASNNIDLNQIEIYSMEGRKVDPKQYKLEQGQKVFVDISALSNGQYILRITSEKNMNSFSFTVKH